MQTQRFFLYLADGAWVFSYHCFGIKNILEGRGQCESSILLEVLPPPPRPPPPNLRRCWQYSLDLEMGSVAYYATPLVSQPSDIKCQHNTWIKWQQMLSLNV